VGDSNWIKIGSFEGMKDRRDEGREGGRKEGGKGGREGGGTKNIITSKAL
jgi:hypothetical protein